jgi:predicted GTPase
MDEASLLLFMVDAATGITDLDDEFAKTAPQKSGRMCL